MDFLFVQFHSTIKHRNRTIIIVILFQVIYLISFLNKKLSLLHNPNKSVTINSETK